MHNKKVSIVSLVFLIALIVLYSIFKNPITIYYKKTHDNINQIVSTYKENKSLKSALELNQLQKMREIQLSYENELLEKAKQTKNQLSKTYTYSVSRIIDTTNLDSLVIDLGEEDGIKKGLSVLSLDQYLIGIVKEVKEHTAAIQLINSESFFETGGISVTVKGKPNSFGVIEELDPAQNLPVINRIPLHDPMAVNDIIVTNGGQGSKYPKGLLVGKVGAFKEDTMGLTKQAVIQEIPEFFHDNSFVFIVFSHSEK